MKHLVVALVILLTILPLPASLQAASNGSSAPVNELIVKLEPGRTLSTAAIAGGLGTEPLRQGLRAAGATGSESLGDQTYRVTFAGATRPQALAARLNRLPGVVYAEPNYERQLLRSTNDPLLGQQWHHSNIQSQGAWDITVGEGVIVAILDTGVSLTHPDLQGRVAGGFDLYNNDSEAQDDEGHGTSTAGLVAANGDNGEGIAGVCWRCTVLPIKVLGARGRGNDATIARGIRLAVDQGARVISMSLGGPEESRALRDAVDYATQRNVLIVAASGNDGTRGTTLNYPAAYPSVLAVSATNPNDNVTSFSTTGDFVDISAPGSNVLSTYWTPDLGDTYAAASGTSEAAPLVAGTAALILSLRPDLNAQQMAELLEATADDVDAPGRDPQSGYGRLNAARAVQLAAAPDALARSKIQGQISGAGADQVTVALNTGQQTTPDANGFYTFENLQTGTYSVVASLPSGQQAAQQIYVSGTPISVATVDLRFGGSADAAFNPVAQPADASAAFFPETSHTLRGTFLAYWKANGGLPVFGFPLSEEFLERGADGREYTVQYFERNRFELHPENAPPYNVQLGRLGDDLLRINGRDWFAFPKGGEQPNCRFFAETGHSLCGAFLQYWSANGLELDGRRGKTAAESLALFGLPLSEPQIETYPDGHSYITQWFERARFEDHGPDGVLLGLLGNEQVVQR